ncbi:MAG: immunoglobulin domain-containing protein, partial [Verrucomicrobiales bacterium]|nr:immunoglobulin domain-containing protein [Verrucomicrobiales bacterium]
LDFDAVTITQVARQSDGKLVVVFVGSKSPSPIAFGVARLTADAAIDTAFVPALTTGATSALTGIGVDGTGRVLVSGSAPTYGGKTVGRVFRLTPTGAIDETFVLGPSVTSAVSVRVFDDGSSLVAGIFQGVFGPVMKLKADGTRDTSYGFTQAGTFGTILAAMASQPVVLDSGTTFVLASAIMVQSGGQFLQGNGPLRLTGSNGGGTVTPPAIGTPPASTAVLLGSTATFTVVATGTAPLAYQWSKNGVAIAGANGPTLTLSNVAESDAGDYAVTVSNLGGSQTSPAAKLVVNRPPRWTVEVPSTLLLRQGVAASIAASAEGPGTLTYQWYRDGQAIPGATTANLSLADPAPSDSGDYEVEVRSEFGSLRSPKIAVTVAPSSPSWFVASEVEGPGQLTDLWHDGARGVVVSGTYAPAAVGNPEFAFGGTSFPRPALLGGFVGRIDDTGTPRWMLPIVGDLSHGLRVATYVAAAADREGNVFVAGPMRGTGSLSGLVLGAAGAEGTFVAKLDPTGKGLWTRFVAGNLYERQLAVDASGNVVLTGRYTSTLTVLTHVIPAMEFGAAAVLKFAPDGTLRWGNRYQKSDSVGGSVDIYNVTTDGDAIYVTGTYSQSIRFGAFTAALPAPPFRDVGWLGKLSADGTPLWLKPIGGSLPKDIAVGASGDVWIVGQDDPPGGQVLHGYRADGTFIFKGVVARSPGNLLAQGVGVDDAGRAIFGGFSRGIATLGSVALGLGLDPRLLWTAAASPAGIVGNDARMTGYVSAPSSGSLLLDEFEGSSNGDGYYAGSWTGVLVETDRSHTNAVRKVFVAKIPGIPLPSAPVIVRHPSPITYTLGDNRGLTCVARGGGLEFRWLKGGQPIPEANLQLRHFSGFGLGEVGSEIVFVGMTAANAGDYTCEVRNGLGMVVSTPATVRLEAVAEPIRLGVPVRVGNRLRLSVPTRAGKNYRLEASGALGSGNWTTAASFAGDGAARAVEVDTGGSHRFLRVAEE